MRRLPAQLTAISAEGARTACPLLYVADVSSTVADINWLLSALAQATAALIAIVGGLLVSRYVALHAEQQSAGRRVQDLARREQEAAAGLAISRTNLARYRVIDALDDDRVFDEVFACGLEPTVDGVLRAIEWDDEELDPDLLSEELEAIRLEMTEDATFLSSQQNREYRRTKETIRVASGRPRRTSVSSLRRAWPSR